MHTHKRRSILFTTAYVICIIYITIISRESHLSHEIKLTPFWSLHEWITVGTNYGSSFLLNVVLFIPLGYLVSLSICKKRRIIAICFIISFAIEAIQYFTYRGLCDIDDLISNMIGAGLGILFYRYSFNLRKKLREGIPFAFIVIGIVGCMITGIKATKIVGPIFEREFNFDITDIQTDGKEVIFSGVCYTYDEITPDYVLSLVNEHTKEKKTVTTRIDGNYFTAIANTDGGKYEVFVSFRDHKSLSTHTYINHREVEYISGHVIEPNINGTELEEVIRKGTLKGYSYDFDTYVYQYNGRIYWLIGYDVPLETEIIYHVYTNENDKLPKHMMKYGFDNLGFQVQNDEDQRIIGNYLIYSEEIPNNYNVTVVVIGLNIDGEITWYDYFRVSD